MMRKNSSGKSSELTTSLLKFLLAVLFAASTLASMVIPANALVEIDINKGNVEPMPIAIAGFGQNEIAGQILQVVNNDLKNSGLFKPIDRAAFIQKLDGPGTPPRFEDWRAINAQALVAGSVIDRGGKLEAQFKLYDVFGNQEMLNKQFVTNASNWRRVAHIIADSIYEKLTGEKGYFDTRIVFIDESGPKTKRVKRLAIMDQDGANLRRLTNGKDLVLTPRFSPNRQEVTYMSFAGGNPRVYLLQLETGQREIVGKFPGMTFAPRFSPDGQKIALSLQKDGNSNIYMMDLRSRNITRLTNTAAIDTSPSFSPDGRRMVFTSDRGGRQQIYVMNSDGSNPQRISFGVGSYSTPVWSPRGDLIAFTKQSGGKFIIGVMKPDGSKERVLTEGYHNEGPTWAPNGRVLMFFRDSGGNGGPKLYSIDITGYNERQIPTASWASDPAWSPLLD